MEVAIAHLQSGAPAALKIVFAEVGPGPTVELGPYREIRIDGEALRAEGSAVTLAKHLPHSWLVKGRDFFRLDCASPVTIHFENEYGDASPVYGPFMHFSCADGIAYGDGAIYGNIDLESKRWYNHQDSRYWREMVVRSASAPAA